jgi:hypothetical protein
MTPEYQFYHGALLHELIINCPGAILIELADVSGRRNCYLIQGQVGLLIKHSSARLSPWTFSFSKDNFSELHDLRTRTRVCFVGLTCGDDGFVCVRDRDFVQIATPTEGEMVSIRVERRPRKMYRVSSSGNALDRKIGRGVSDIVQELGLSQVKGAGS